MRVVRRVFLIEKETVGLMRLVHGCLLQTAELERARSVGVDDPSSHTCWKREDMSLLVLWKGGDKTGDRHGTGRVETLSIFFSFRSKSGAQPRSIANDGFVRPREQGRNFDANNSRAVLEIFKT